MASNNEIYATIEKLGTPGKLPGKWSLLPCHKAFFFPPPDLRTQLKDYPDEDLRSAGVLIQDKQHGLVLTPLLAQTSKLVMATRRSETDAPEHLVADGYAVLTKTSGALPILSDHRLIKLAKDRDRIVVTGSQEDTAILWSSGLPATTFTGVEDFGQKAIAWLQEFSRKLLVPPGFVEYPLSAQLVLANWSISALDPSDQPHMPQLRRQCHYMNKCLETNLFRGVWQPTFEECAQFAFAVSKGLQKELRTALLDSYHDDELEPCHGGPSRSAVLRTYAGATQEVLRIRSDQVDRFSRQDAFNNLQKVHEHLLIAPLLRLSDESPDPLERNLLTLLSLISRRGHVGWSKLTARLQRTAQPTMALLPFPTAAGEDVNELLALTDRALALTQALWRNQSTKRRKS